MGDPPLSFFTVEMYSRHCRQLDSREWRLHERDLKFASKFRFVVLFPMIHRALGSPSGRAVPTGLRGETALLSPVGILREMYKQSNLFVGNDLVSFREGNNIRWYKFQKKYPTNFLY